jgi:carboxymethylenebutenolidase
MSDSADPKPPGFAAAAQPIAATTRIETDASGLDAADVGVHSLGVTVPAYRAYLSGRPRRPVVLVVQEVFGLHEYIRDVVRRLAKLGYYAIAPSLFHRQGDATGLTSFDAIRALTSKVPDAQVLADLDSCVTFAESEGADADKLGITGFCWGGRVVWLYAAHQPRLKAAVAWYGRLQGDKTANQPRHPLDVAGELKAPVLGLYGGADAGIPLESIKAFEARLQAAGSPSQIHVFPEAPHAFHSDYRPSYRQAAAEDGWKRMQEWFEKYLKP